MPLQNFPLAPGRFLWRITLMRSSRHRLTALFFALSLIAAPWGAHASAKDWPEGYEIAEHSESPDGNYGVLIADVDTGGALDEDKITDVLVHLKTHKRLAVIKDVRYYSGQNHQGLRTAWAADSSWCAVTYEGRYGFENITLVEIHDGKCTQTDVGKHIQDALDPVIKKASHGDTPFGYAGAYFRSGPGHSILVRGTAFTNPKSMPNEPTYCSLFLGTFDLDSKKWTRSEARKVTSKEKDDWESALDGFSEDERTFNNDEDRLTFYDERLNTIYGGVRTALPAERFAAVKKEQFAWVKKLEAQPSAAAKCKLIAARIKVLEDLVW